MVAGGGGSGRSCGGERDSTRWSSTLSSKVNLPHVINFRVLCGANVVACSPKPVRLRRPGLTALKMSCPKARPKTVSNKAVTRLQGQRRALQGALAVTLQASTLNLVYP